MKYQVEQGVKIVKEKITIQKKPAIIAVSGRSCSGKTTISKKLGFITLSLDDYYFGIDKMPSRNFDNPNTIDFNLLRDNLIDFKSGKNFLKPKYDFTIHKRVSFEKVYAKDVIIIEGLFAFHEKIIDLIDIKLFISSKEHICLKRRVLRDQKERGRSKENILKQYFNFVKPGYEQYILPTIKDAIIIQNN